MRYINDRFRRSGTSWEGRFKSSLATGDDYLLRWQRYTERNPVRARMVADPGEYRWSKPSKHWAGRARRARHPARRGGTPLTKQMHSAVIAADSWSWRRLPRKKPKPSAITCSANSFTDHTASAAPFKPSSAARLAARASLDPRGKCRTPHQCLSTREKLHSDPRFFPKVRRCRRQRAVLQ